MTARAVPFAVLLLFTSAPLAAQHVDVAASVPLRSPAGAGVRDLTFGVVAPIAGTSQIVDVAAAVAPMSGTVQSGAFRYGVATLRGLDFTFNLPSELASPEGSVLPVGFMGTRYGGYCVTTGGATCTLTSFDPSTADVRVCRQTVGSGNCHPNNVFPAGSELAIYIGGLLAVPPTAPAGNYTATVTLTIVQVY